jgi:hypothetical protein
MGPVILTFPSTHQAMAAEDLLRDAGVRLQVIPAPPRPTRICGLALRLSASDAPEACRLLDLGSVVYERSGPAG